ncbi:MAG: VWA domain-containing protein, partial [Bacteroidota bacterium]
MSKTTIEFFSQSENDYYQANNTQNRLYIYLQLNGRRHETSQKRLPLNISCIMDKSGSMHGEKLENVKKALDFVIGQLRSEDQLSIVEYDSNVSVLSAQAPVRDKEALKKKVAAIVSGSATNLSGGMLEGYSQVRSTKKDGFVNRALLLSDGLANQGVTDPIQLQQIAQKKFRED